MEKEYNNHHGVPLTKGGLTNEHNLIRMPKKDHERWHTRCGNDTPVEAICRVLLTNEKIFTEHFKQDLIDILDRYLNNYYEKKTHNGFIKSEVETVLDLEDTLFLG